jgi:hypothetical protein
MGNYKMEHHQYRLNKTPLILLKIVVVETRKQHVRIKVSQSFNVGITTTRVEIVVAPSIDVVRREVLIGFPTKLGSGLGGVLVIRNLSRSLALPTTTTRVVGIPQMVFTNPITIIHVNRIANRPLMNSMATKRCRSVDVVHSKGGYREPIVITIPILDHRNGHYVKSNKVTFKYPDFKKDVYLDVHVRVFNSEVKENANTS